MRHFTMKFLFTVLALLTATSTESYAQNLLGELTFEVPDKLCRPTANVVWLKEAPRAKAPRYKAEQGGEDVWITKHKLYAVGSAPAGWWNIDGGYCMANQARLSVGKPLTDNMFNRFFGWCEGYDDGGEWIVGRTASTHGFVVCYENSGLNSLWLGKQEGNVLVFKYRIFCSFNIDEGNSNPNYINLHTEDRDGMTMYEITIGKNFVQEVTWGGMGTTKTLNFSKLNDKVIEYLFKKAIEEWSWRDSYFYLNSELLSGAYANYQLG